MNSAYSLIQRFGRSYRVRRQQRSGDYVLGHWVPTGNKNTFEIIASIQPIDGKTMQQLPEGERSMEMRTLYTTTELLTVDEQGQRNPDVVTIDCEEWEVHKVEKWFPLLDHYKCIIIRMNRQEAIE